MEISALVAVDFGSLIGIMGGSLEHLQKLNDEARNCFKIGLIELTLVHKTRRRSATLHHRK